MIIKKNNKELLYYIGLFLTTLSASLVGHTYLFLIPNLNPLLKYGAIICFLVSFITRRWKKSNLFRSVVMIIIVLAVVLATDSNMLFIYILAIILSKPGDFDEICRFLFWLNLFIFILVLGMCGIGILNDEITIHNGQLAHSLGYAYYSSPAYTVFFLTVLAYYLYFGKCHTFGRIMFFIISIIANYTIYKWSTVRLSFLVYLLFIGLIILYEYFGFIKKTKFNRILGTLMYPLMFTLSVILPFVYTRSPFLVGLDSMINSRLYFSRMGFLRYDVNFFGNHVITNAGGFDENWHNTYFFIDCGYVNTLLRYGIIVTLAILIIYTIVSRNAAIHKNTKLFIWCILVCIFAFINDPLTSIILNPLLFITVPLFDEMRKERKNAKTNINR